MNIVILDDYQDVVRKLDCASKLDSFQAKVYTNTVKGLGQLSVRLRDADILVLIRERTHLNRQLIEKLPRLKLISQTGRMGEHVDLQACTARGIAVAEGGGSPIAPAELTWALLMAAARRLPHYIGNLKHGAWQQSGLKAGSMPSNFGLGTVLNGKTLGIWGYGRIGKLVAGYGKAFGMNVVIWGSENAQNAAIADGYSIASSREALFSGSDFLSLHLRLSESTMHSIKHADLALMKSTAVLINTSRAGLIDQPALQKLLIDGKIAGAGLDVYDAEPLAATDAWRKTPRTLLTPHLGYVTPENFAVFYANVVADIQAWASGSPIRVLN